jgi:hypothetical protein
VLKQDDDWGPLSFMRAFFCLDSKLQRTCRATNDFDVWAMDPYTSGGPLHHAYYPNDASLGDLPKVRKILNAAILAGNTTNKDLRLWITEFGWDSNPPDAGGVPMKLLTRWVAEGLYRMWQNQVSLVTWFAIRDAPLNVAYWQSGLYYNGGSDLLRDRPKPILQAFRFPFVAYPTTMRRLTVWGRTPDSAAHRIVIQQWVPSGTWRRIGVVHSNGDGIFRSVKVRRIGPCSVRAALGSDFSAAYSLIEEPDHFYNPFGSNRGVVLEPDHVTPTKGAHVGRCPSSR